MKGVVLAGGPGTRLDPLTRVTHKHLLPVYDRPAIFHALRTLVDADIGEILIVVGGPHADAPKRLLGDGATLGFGRLRYALEREERGPASALLLAERFADAGPLCVIGGGDIVERNVQRVADVFRENPVGAKVLLKRVPDPSRHEIARMRDRRIIGVVERPARPPSRYAVTGVRFYDATLFDRIRALRVARERLELADVDDAYARSDSLSHAILRGWWIAAETFEDLATASSLVARGGVNKL